MRTPGGASRFYDPNDSPSVEAVCLDYLRDDSRTVRVEVRDPGHPGPARARTHWDDLVLLDAADLSPVVDPARRFRALRELRARDAMVGVVCARLPGQGEDCSTWGPPAEQIDWAGFDS